MIMMSRHLLKSLPSNRGMTLFELSIVLLFASVISAGAMIAADVANKNALIQKSANSVRSIIVDAKSMFGRRNQYQFLSHEEALSAGVYPKEILVSSASGTEVISQFGGQVLLSSYNMRDDEAYLRIEKVPKSYCMSFVMEIEANTLRLHVGTDVDLAPPVADSEWSVKLKGDKLNLPALQSVCSDSTSDHFTVHATFGRT
jgi:Tfp pilus assembly protein PilE